jgi:hypothetical protein
MNPLTLSLLALLLFLLTAGWLGLFIAGTAAAGPIETLEQALAVAARQDPAFVFSYLNAALLTLVAVALFAGLYSNLRDDAPGWTRVALAFVPIYGVFALTAYLSQLTLVPSLLGGLDDPETAGAARLLLAQTMQNWPGSFVNFLNNLAYGVLGVPSIIFGALLARRGALFKAAGVLLVLNGIACIIGVAGILTGIELLTWGSIIGGVLFLLALPPLALGYYRIQGPGAYIHPE